VSTKKRVYTQEFKEEAVKLAIENGIPQTANDLNVNPVNIRRWVKNFKEEDSSILSESEVQKELRLAKKEIHHLKKINDILKKSLGIFAEDQRANFN
jgi:transposase